MKYIDTLIDTLPFILFLSALVWIISAFKRKKGASGVQTTQLTPKPPNGLNIGNKVKGVCEAGWKHGKEFLKKGFGLLLFPLPALLALVAINAIGGFLFPSWWEFLQEGKSGIPDSFSGLATSSEKQKFFWGIQAGGLLLIFFLIGGRWISAEYRKSIIGLLVIAMAVGFFSQGSPSSSPKDEKARGKTEVHKLVAKPGEFARFNLPPKGKFRWEAECSGDAIIQISAEEIVKCGPGWDEEVLHGSYKTLAFHPAGKETVNVKITLTRL